MKLACTQRGFTLIELLVVMLIIGILAAVALPQYQKAVEKTKATTVLPLLKSVFAAAESFYLANGTLPYVLKDMDVSFPSSWDKKTSGFLANGVQDSQANKDWSLEIYNIGKNEQNDYLITTTRLTGPYKGAGFLIPLRKRNTSIFPTLGQVYCFEAVNQTEVIYNTNLGSYCEKFWRGILLGGQDIKGYKF